MFQVATVYALAKDYNDECAFPLDRTEMGQGHPARTYITNIFKHIKELPAGWQPQYRFKEASLNYYPVPYRCNMELFGYFPSERYFAHHKQAVLALFKDYDVIDELKRQWAKVLVKSVAFHIRRGDYLYNPTTLPVPPKTYYKRALAYIETKADIKHILVFSDDVAWCKRNWSDKRITFIEGQPDFKDMYLMSLCNHLVMPNSGFSWWGGYLNENPNKIICAPAIWFGSTGVPGIRDNYTKEMTII
jgi:hypothetical protein